MCIYIYILLYIHTLVPPSYAKRPWYARTPVCRYCRWITNGIGLSNHRQCSA